jgi:preprotein translocase subunit SecG
MTIVLVLQIIFSVIVIALTLVQSKGTGLSSMVSSSIGYYRSRRGVEKTVFFLTILGIILFSATSLLLVIQQ